MKISWIRLGSKSNDRWPYKRQKRRHTQRWKGEGHVNTKAGINVMHLQAKECVEPPGAGGGKEGCFHRASSGARPCQHFDFRLLASRPMREYASVVLGHSLCGNVLLLCLASAWHRVDLVNVLHWSKLYWMWPQDEFCFPPSWSWL